MDFAIRCKWAFEGVLDYIVPWCKVVLVICALIWGYIGFSSPEKILNQDIYRIVEVREDVVGIGTSDREEKYSVKLSKYYNSDGKSFTVDLKTEQVYADLLCLGSERFYKNYVVYTPDKGFSSVEADKIETERMINWGVVRLVLYVGVLVVVLPALVIFIYRVIVF